MKINELGTILSAIAKCHGKESGEVVIDAIKYESGKTLHVSTSTANVDVIASIILNKENEEEKAWLKRKSIMDGRLKKTSEKKGE